MMSNQPITAKRSQTAPALGELGQAVLQGMTSKQKTLPCRYFYDHRGSELFEEITQLPEYYPTRTEKGILQAAGDEIISRTRQGVGDLQLVEFGSGSSSKTRLIIEAMLRQAPELTYMPIDISAEFLAVCADQLQSEYKNLNVQALPGEYFQVMSALPESSSPRLFLFLGSNIGNFETDEASRFLGTLRRCLGPQDRVLLGVDLVKDQDVLEAAYNDSAGVTAAFNKNVLLRINAELDADFDPDAFNHTAPWVPEFSRIEMHLESRWRQEIRIGALDRTFSFFAGETIHTENSHKYTPASLAKIADSACLEPLESWSDPQNWFALTLFAPV